MKKKTLGLMLLAIALMMTAVFAGCTSTTATTTTTAAETTTAAQQDETTVAAEGDSDTSLAYIQDKGTLVLGLDDSFPPMGYRDENNKIVGYDIDLATEVCKRLGVELKLQPIDWTAKENELNTKKIDCIWNGMSIDEERKQNMTLSIPYLDNSMSFVVKSDSGIKTLADMAGKKLALQSGSTAATALDEAADFKATLGEVVGLKDNMTALMDLEMGGVDVVLMDDVVANYYIATNNKPFELLEETLSTEEYAVGFRKGDEALANAVNETLQEMAKDGKLNEITQKWFGKDNTKIQ
jgi:polar amino acid transport system substrate-binding protein